MKRLSIIPIISALLVLTACSMNKEDVIDKTLETQQSVENYSVTYGITIDVQTNFRNDTSSVKGTASIYESPAALHQVFTSTTKNGETSVEGYLLGEESYIKEGDADWTFHQVEANSIQFEPSYQDVLSIIKKIETATEFHEQDHTYELSFEGYDQTIYDTLASPFNVELTEFDVEKDVEMQLHIRINEDDYTVQSIAYKVNAENEESGSVIMDIHMDYEDFNNLEEISIPQEVQDAI